MARRRAILDGRCARRHLARTGPGAGATKSPRQGAWALDVFVGVWPDDYATKYLIDEMGGTAIAQAPIRYTFFAAPFCYCSRIKPSGSGAKLPIIELLSTNHGNAQQIGARSRHEHTNTYWTLSSHARDRKHQ